MVDRLLTQKEIIKAMQSALTASEFESKVAKAQDAKTAKAIIGEVDDIFRDWVMSLGICILHDDGSITFKTDHFKDGQVKLFSEMLKERLLNATR